MIKNFNQTFFKENIKITNTTTKGYIISICEGNLSAFCYPLMARVD